MSKRLIILFGTVLLVFVLAACSNSSTNKVEEVSATNAGASTNTQTSTNTEAADTKVVKDIFGGVTIPAQPENMLVMSTGYAEYLIEMGITPKMVLFVSELEPAYRAPYFKKHGVEMIESVQYEQNYEQLLSLSPDLIVGQGGGMEKKVYDELTKIAPTVAVNAGVGMFEAMPELAKIFNKEAESVQSLTEFNNKAVAAKEKIHQAIGDKTVLVLRVEPKQYRYLGSHSDGASAFFYQTLGLKIPDIFKDTQEWFTPFSLEILPNIKPDYIFLEERKMQNYDSSESLKLLEDNVLWGSMDAVKNNQVFPLSTNDYVQGEGPVGSSLLIDYVVGKLVP